MKNLLIGLLALGSISAFAQEVSNNDAELCVGKAYMEIMSSETVKERLEKALSESDYVTTNKIALKSGELAALVCNE